MIAPAATPNYAEVAERDLRIVTTLLDGLRDDRALVVKAPPGAGKSTLVRGVARLLQRRGVVPIVTQTNAQADDLVLALHRENPALTVARLHGADGLGVAVAASTINSGGRLQTGGKLSDLLSLGARIIVAPAAKWAYEHPAAPFRRMIIDECYQMRADALYAIANHAEQILLIGDPGQLSPFTKLDTDRWQALPHSPIRPAMDILFTNHPRVPVHNMGVSWRLPPSAAGLVSDCFYPDVPFIPGTAAAHRALRLTNRRFSPRVAADSAIHTALDQAARTGWAYLELTSRHTARADDQTAQTLTDLTIALLDRQATITSELISDQNGRRLGPEDLAVVTAHNDQANLVQAKLEDLGVDLDRMTVTTANKIQGREFAITLVWHPLAGRVDATEFHLDPGRMCVMLSRHRHASIVVGRAGADQILLSHPDNTELIVGENQPEVDGYTAHWNVLDHLAHHRVPAF
ncbi:AAA family ATPase [Micromonospora parva]|uniref:AAA family ATPase n=1 Tax=Micromonospora parva TaxID=1464048 RepID=UPI0034063389